MSKLTHLIQIGKNIRQLREHRKLTQEQLAKKAGIRTATISEIEAGKSDFRFNTLVKIAAALNCYVDISITPAS